MDKIGLDKKQHFAGGFALCLAAGLALVPEAGLLLAVAVGLGKELYDKLSGKGTPETLDVIATVAGGFIGYALLVFA